MANDVRFRTRDDSSELGAPTRAKPCSCGRQVVDKNDGLCVMCGRETRSEIDREWDQQAWRNRKSARVSSPRPFREHVNGKIRRIVFDHKDVA